MPKQSHHVTIYEEARDCSPWREDERTDCELIDYAIEEGAADEFADIDGVDSDGTVIDRDAFDDWMSANDVMTRELREFLDVEVLRSETDPERCIVEFLLTCGGPTVRVIVDTRYDSVEYFHSWGYHDNRDCELDTWEISGTNRDAWLNVVNDYFLYS